MDLSNALLHSETIRNIGIVGGLSYFVTSITTPLGAAYRRYRLMRAIKKQEGAGPRDDKTPLSLDTSMVTTHNFTCGDCGKKVDIGIVDEAAMPSGFLKPKIKRCKKEGATPHE